MNVVVDIMIMHLKRGRCRLVAVDALHALDAYVVRVAELAALGAQLQRAVLLRVRHVLALEAASEKRDGALHVVALVNERLPPDVVGRVAVRARYTERVSNGFAAHYQLVGLLYGAGWFCLF